MPRMSTGRGLNRASPRAAVSWFRDWSDVLDEAIELLPDAETCPRDLHRELLAANCAAGGAAVMVERDQHPIAVIGLRPAGALRWEVQTNWMTPGFVCAAEHDDILPALAAVRRDLVVAWWRMPATFAHSSVRHVRTTPVHQIRTADRQAYWSRRMRQRIASARRKCASLDLSVNQPGDAAWVIESWAQKWGIDQGQPASATAVEDRIRIAEHLEPIGRHVTLVLRDGETPIAGATSYVHDGTLVAGTLYRDDSIESLPTGVRMIDAVFEYAAQQHIETIDLGGGHDYKIRWAPERAEHHELIVSPRLLRHARAAMRTTRQIGTSAYQRVRGAVPFGHSASPSPTDS